MRRANAACDWLSQKAWESGVFRQFDLHKISYHACRAEFPDLASQISAHRELHFKNADAWLTYNEKYGAWSPTAAIVESFRIAARNTAVLREFGTQPEQMYKELISSAKGKHGATYEFQHIV